MELLQDATVWVLISFTIFAVFAWIKGRGLLLAKLDGHIAQVRKEIETAEALRFEAEQLLAQYKNRQRDATKEAQDIVSIAKKQAEQITLQAETDLKEAATRRETQLQERLRRMEESAMAEIRAYAAALAVKATKEIISDKMDDKTNAKLVDESIRQVAGRLN